MDLEKQKCESVMLDQNVKYRVTTHCNDYIA